MATPQTEPSTKKAFNFPKGTANRTATSAKADKKPQAKPAPKSKAKAAAPAQPAIKKTDAPKKAASKAATPKTPEPAPAPAAESAVKTKAKRVKKEKVVRDSFTMPKSDYAKLASLKQKCQDNGLRVKMSELLRAALTMLDAAPEKRIIAAIKALETVKTGRPANA